MTPDLEQIKQREQAATPGPWKMWNGWGPLIDVEPELMACERVGPDYEGGFVPGEGAVDIYASRADFEFVAAAREDIPALLAAIDKLTAENAALKQKADVWTAQAAIWRTSNVTIVDKLIQSTSSYEDRIDELEARNAKLEAVVDVAAECYNARLDSDMPVPWWRLKAALDALTEAVEG